MAESNDAAEKERLAAQQAKLAAESAESERLLQEAKQAEEAAFAETKKNRKTVAFLPQQAEDELLTGLKKATEEFDAGKLEELIGRGTETGLHDDVFDEARKVYTSLQSDVFLLKTIEEVRAVVDGGKDESTLALKQLENLMYLLRTMPGYENEASQAAGSMQKAMVDFNSNNAEEVLLASRTFDDLSTFSRLKPDTVWGGHRLKTSRSRKTVRTSGRKTARMTRIGDLVEESMTSFCKGCIVEAMTKAPKGRNVDKYEAAALQNFRNLLVCMGERTAQSVQRKASEEAIVTLADEDHKMLDEVYMQVMKQLTKKSVGAFNAPRFPTAASSLSAFCARKRACRICPSFPQGTCGPARS